VTLPPELPINSTHGHKVDDHSRNWTVSPSESTQYNHQNSPFYTNLLVVVGIDFTLGHCGLSISCNKQVLEKHHEKHHYIILWHQLKRSWNHKNDNNIWMSSCDWVITVAGRRWDCLLPEGIPSVVVWAAAIPWRWLVGPALEVGSLNQEPVPDLFYSYNSSIWLHWLLQLQKKHN